MESSNTQIKIESGMSNGGSGAYAPVNGLNMYYEIHGTGGTPLVLLHGALSATETSFGQVLPLLAQNRKVISIEQQAHGRTADVDRPLTIPQMAEDTAALLRHIGVESADLFGYSMGAGIALQVAIQHPNLVRKLVIASLAYQKAGMHPGMGEGMDSLKPEDMAGSPFYEEYARLAPDPAGWANLVYKVVKMNGQIADWPDSAIQSLQAPVLIMLGDSDIVQPEHAVHMFRLLGGGVMGDIFGLPKSRLAILPGTTHVTMAYRPEWVSSMIADFLDAPLPAAE